VRHGAEVTIGARIRSLAANPAAGGAARWPLLDSLGRQLATLVRDRGRFRLVTLGGTRYRAGVVNVRGRGCAASLAQQRRFTLVQVIARAAPGSGTQGFLDTAALDASTPSGRVALRAFRRQRGGGTGCGPRRPERGRPRPLANPRVAAAAHARLSSGELNTVTEYDAKPMFGNVVYFSTNTTSVSVGGIARGMVRVGTPVAKVDEFRACDPNSDGTLTWRYWSIRTGDPRRPRLYGWIPGRCRRQTSSAPKVSQLAGSPAFRPLSNQRLRCSDEPCVNDSSFTALPALRWSRSSPTASAARNASSTSPASSWPASKTPRAQTPA
jgi:hypothetical protein